MRALVMFTHGAAHPLRFLLKPGFRHCFLALHDGTTWVVIDAVAGVPFVSAVHGDEDLKAFYEADGCTVVETVQRTRPPFGPFAVANCVGLVKAMLAIDAPLVWTPRQLYRHLTRD